MKSELFLAFFLFLTTVRKIKVGRENARFWNQKRQGMRRVDVKTRSSGAKASKIMALFSDVNLRAPLRSSVVLLELRKKMKVKRENT